MLFDRLVGDLDVCLNFLQDPWVEHHDNIQLFAELVSDAGRLDDGGVKRFWVRVHRLVLDVYRLGVSVADSHVVGRVQRKYVVEENGPEHFNLFIQIGVAVRFNHFRAMEALEADRVVVEKRLDSDFLYLRRAERAHFLSVREKLAEANVIPDGYVREHVARVVCQEVDSVVLYLCLHVIAKVRLVEKFF